MVGRVLGDGAGLPLEVLTERWAYLLGKDLPFPKLVEIPAGSFMMGSDRGARGERPIHRVTFSRPFCLGATEVTFREWDACVVNNGCSGYRPSDEAWGRGTRPVINVSWYDAQAYVEWLSRKTGRECRLPSEAEWEYAARAGTTTEYTLTDEAQDCRQHNGLDQRRMTAAALSLRL